MFRIGRLDFEFPRDLSPNTFALHKLGDSVFAAKNSGFVEFFMHARTAVVVMLWQGINAFDFVHDLLLFSFRIGYLGSQILVERSPRNL